LSKLFYFIEILYGLTHIIRNVPILFRAMP
jgi:hypothetical protein